MPHMFLVSLLIAVALFTGIGPRLATSALAETTTTINFDNLAPGTSVTNQYESQGVDFTGDILPFVDQVGSSLASSGTQVADMSHCSGCEFFTPSVQGTLVNSASRVSVDVGYFANSASPGDTAAITLTVLDSGTNVIGTDTKTVTEGLGFRTVLSVTSTSANIVSFRISGTDNVDTDKLLGIDDLTFDNPAGAPPDFSLSPTTSLVNVNQGSSSTDVITINRFNGSQGPVKLSASSIPSGMQVSFSPNPASASTTMTVKAGPNVKPTGNTLPKIKITGTPISASAGPAPRSIKVAVQVKVSFYITFESPSAGVPPCSDVPVTVDVNYSSGFSSDVTLSLSGLPAGVQGKLNPVTVSPPTDGGRVSRSTLTLTSNTDINGPSGDVIVTGTSGPLTSTSLGPLSVSRVPPSITSVSPPSGHTPQALLGGSEVVVTGKGLCPGMQHLAFGNQQAELTPIPVAPGGTQLQAIVPRLATTGPIYAIPLGGTIGSPGTAASPSSFTVDSYRNANGFSFTNSDQFQSNVGGYSFSDVSDVFGYDQTHLGFNPCWPFGDCTVSTPIPDPLALIFWGIADHFGGENGQCFGFSLGSQRLLHGDQSYSSFPSQNPSVTSVWNLQGPDSSGGPSGKVAHYIHLTHMEQFSAEALHYWLAQATVNAISGDQSSIISQITAALAAHDHPLIEIRNGTDGHVVVAYDVEDGANGDKLIDVYDPNQNYTTTEENVSGTTHQAILTNSQITVHPNGHWEFPGFSPAWHAGPGSLVVVPYGTVPVHPDMPTTGSGLFDFVFGSAHPSQVTDAAGHTLLQPNGDINTDPKTGIPDATRFATLAGSTKPGSDIFLFGKTGVYKQTVVGKSAGQYTDALMGNGMAVSLKAGSAKRTVDDVTVDPRNATVGFGAASGKTSGPNAGIIRPVTAEMYVQAGDGTKRTATVVTSLGAGRTDAMSFTGSGAGLALKHAGPATSYSLALSWAGPNAAPQTFITPPLKMAAGDKASFSPQDWSKLGAGTLKVKVQHRNGSTTTTTLHNTVKPAAKFSVSLKVGKRVHGKRTLTIATKFMKLIKGSSAVLTWETLHGAKLVGHSTKSLTGKKLHRGKIAVKKSFKTTAGRSYTFKGTVTVVSPNKAGSFDSQIQAKQKAFKG
jgi:hypothetical protein